MSACGILHTNISFLSVTKWKSGKMTSVARARFSNSVSPCLYWSNHVPFCVGEGEISTEGIAGISNPSGSEVAPGVKCESSGR